MYVGQSHDIEQRLMEHLYHNSSPIDRAIHEYGIENFEIIIEKKNIPDEELDYWEQYYINHYNSNQPFYGYNQTYGGKGSIGSTNPTAQLSEEDVYFIRECYSKHISQKEIYEYFKDKISFGTLQNILQGKSWTNIHMDVYTEENKSFYNRDGFSYINDNGLNKVFSDDEVIELRNRYVNESAKQIYESVKDRCRFQTLQQILWGRSYSNLPIYDKKHKTWNN